MSKTTFKLTEKERNSLAENIKKFRGVLSQRVLADRMGIPRQYRQISLFENGKNEPSQTILLTFAQTVGVNIFDIIPEKAFDKLAVEMPTKKTKAFDLQKAKEEPSPDQSEFDIMITEGLLKEVSNRNTFDMPISHIITAGLNYFLHLSSYDALKFVLTNVKDAEFEKVLIDKVMAQEKYKDGIEVLRNLISRTLN